MTTNTNTAPALREKLIELIAGHLSGTYHCLRVWEAWHVGTMSQDDFEDVGESDTPAELADAILAAISIAAQPPAPREPLTIGTRGSAYDTPTQRRAYTYKEQPGNVGAYRLGEALKTAAKDTAGDSIDAGLSLLKRLEEMGFGVFEAGEGAHGIKPAHKEQTGYQAALDIRASQGWTLSGKAVPVLYTDTINGRQVCRDDVWLCTTDALAAQPSPAPQSGWISVDERLPEAGKPVLLDIGKKYPIRAMWAAKFTLAAVEHDADWGEYNEATDAYYCPEGWYEWNEHEEVHWRVHADAVAWLDLPLPLPPFTIGEPV